PKGQRRAGQARARCETRRRPCRPAGVGGRLCYRLCHRIGRTGEACCPRRRRRPLRCRRSQTSVGAHVMKAAHLIVLAALSVAAPAVSQAQVAGSTFLGSTYAELRDVAVGWSVRKQIIGSPVFNDLNERIGSIDDVIVTSDKSVSYAII